MEYSDRLALRSGLGQASLSHLLRLLIEYMKLFANRSSGQFRVSLTISKRPDELVPVYFKSFSLC